MAQRNRHAHAGTWHHVYNRGIGERVIFATRAVLQLLEEHAAALSACRAKLSRKSLDPQRLAQAGLLHELTGMRCEQIASRMSVTNGTVSRWIRAHRLLAQEDSDYASVTAAIARGAIAASHRTT